MNGTLLDDLGLVLQSGESNSVAIVHLLVDGIPVSSVETSSDDGFALSYLVPSSTSPGLTKYKSNSRVERLGGSNWCMTWKPRVLPANYLNS